MTQPEAVTFFTPGTGVQWMAGAEEPPEWHARCCPLGGESPRPHAAPPRPLLAPGSRSAIETLVSAPGHGAAAVKSAVASGLGGMGHAGSCFVGRSASSSSRVCMLLVAGNSPGMPLAARR